jgi:hypothetical protein
MKVSAEISGIDSWLKDIDIDFSPTKVNRARVKNIVDNTQRKLERDTPVDSGKTARSWSNDVDYTRSGIVIDFNNSNLTKYDTPVVSLITNGHATRNGGYIPPNDFVSPLVDKFEEDLLTLLD